MEDSAKITKVSFGMFGQDNVQYADGDIVLIDNINDLVDHSSKDAYEMDLVAMMFCSCGKAQMRINEKEYDMHMNDMLIVTPMSIIEDIMISPDFKCFAVGLSYNAIQQTFISSRKIWDIRTFLLKSPVIHLDENGQKVGAAYRQLLMLKLEERNNLFYKDIMHSLFSCVFFELASIIQPLAVETPVDDGLKQGQLLCKRFLDMLTKSEGRERSVSHYADLLCVTPKYLSTVTKETSGKTALEWIHLCTVENIKRKLKYSSKTIKEIADEMNFPNLSFFGKFVRTHTGMSPTEFRRHIFDGEKQ